MNKKPTVTISENRTELPELATLITGLLMATNYKETVTACEALLSLAIERPVTVARRGDRIRVLLNTPNRRTLAMGIVDGIRHYFGIPGFAPANTADPGIIVERATAWAQAQPDADWLNSQDYAAFVFWATDEALAKLNLDEAEHNAVFDAVQKWYEKQSQSPNAHHGEQTTPSTGIKTEALKALFLPVFFGDDFKQRETLNGTTKLTRFDIFVEQLESLLSDTKCDKKRIGNVAYMVYKSRYKKKNFRKFAPLCRLLFECCQIEAPKDQRPNKYNQPDNDTLERFSDALGNPLNPQK